MEQDIEKMIESLSRKSPTYIKKLILEPYTWEFEQEGKEYQGEVVATWEDKANSIVRLIGYQTAINSRWCKQLYNRSTYEKTVKLKL